MGQIKRQEPERLRNARAPGLPGQHLVVQTNPGDGDTQGNWSIRTEILASLRKTAYTVNEVIETASVGRTTLYAHANAGSLRLTKVGTKTIILATDLAAWLALLRSGAA